MLSNHRTSCASMDESRDWSHAPVEITERVLSLLPVRDLCVCRSVCKSWNKLLRQPDFFTQYHRKDKYLLVTGHVSDVSDGCIPSVVEDFRRAPCLFDLEKLRWISIPNAPPLLAMNDGLICELTTVHGEFRLRMIDPVAKTTQELPALPAEWEKCSPQFRLQCNTAPAIVTIAEKGQFQVFFFSICNRDPQPGLFLYESKSQAWRDLGSPVPMQRSSAEVRRMPQEAPIPKLYVPGFSEYAVSLHGHIYAAFTLSWRMAVLVVSFNLKTHTWKEVTTVQSNSSGRQSLSVAHNRLFLSVWVGGNSRLLSFEIWEILATQGDHGGSSLVVQISHDQMMLMFHGWRRCVRNRYETHVQFDVGYGVPLDAELRSVLLVSRETGNMVRYNVETKGFWMLPEHPWKRACLQSMLRDSMKRFSFQTQVVNLSFQSVLADTS